MSEGLPKVGDLEGKTIAIVAMGRSAAGYMILAAHHGGRKRVADYVIAINAMGGVIYHDLLIAMDDLRIQEARIEAMAEGRIAENPPLVGTMAWLKEYDRPWLTSRAWEQYPHAQEMPIEDVINDLGTAYFNNTVSWAVAWALHHKPGTLKLFGCDFSYGDSAHKAESGRGSVEYLLGIAHARGVKVEVPVETTLLDACVPASEKPYGFDTEDVSIAWEDGRATVTRTPREKLPTAEEIEYRYRRVK